MTLTSDSWLTLIVSLPSASATARMRIWRAVKTLGCAALRDGAYLLPAQAEQAAQLQVLADEALQEGGQAWLLQVQARNMTEQATFQALFDRAADYTPWLEELAQPNSSVHSASMRVPMRSSAKSTSFPVRRRSAPTPSGAISPTPSKPCSHPVSRSQQRATLLGVIACSTRGESGPHAAISGWTAWRVPG
jgi:hypothetical protein